MTDYEYILSQCRKRDSETWSDESVKDMINHLESLSDEDICALIIEKEIQDLGTTNPFWPENNSQIFVINKKQVELKTAIIKAVPTLKLLELIYGTWEDYERINGRVRSYSTLQYRHACNSARDELRRRYVKNIDTKIIEKAFSRGIFNTNREWLKWQKKKQKAAAIRYQNQYLKSLEDIEIYFTDEELNHGLIVFDNVISVKGCRRFWDEDGIRLCAVHNILNDLCSVVTQYVGVGDEVLFAVAPDDYNLHADFENTHLHKKLYEIIDKEYQRNLVLACILIEKFIHLLDPKVNAKARYYDRDYLVGHFVVEGWYTNQLFPVYSFSGIVEKMAPEERQKMKPFLEQVDILLNPPQKVPF